MSARISVCIPAYNRAALLQPLLESILTQDYDNFEIVICEDDSPERQAIAEVVARYAATHPGRIRLFENEQNLGYDRNLRRLIELAEGDYCMFMGNDDLLAPGAADLGQRLQQHLPQRRERQPRLLQQVPGA